MWVSGFLGPGLVLLLDPRQFQPVILAIPAVILLLWLMLFRMVTTVDQDRLTVTFGWIPTYRRVILLSEIEEAQAVSYNPIREFGGWGIRGLPVSCLNARGNQGVNLRLRGGRALLIGSQRPHDLQAALSAHKS